MEAAEAERDQLRAMLDSERGAAFLSLGQFQKQQVRRLRAVLRPVCLQRAYRCWWLRRVLARNCAVSGTLGVQHVVARCRPTPHHGSGAVHHAPW